jgi:hypothetical protein
MHFHKKILAACFAFTLILPPTAKAEAPPPIEAFSRLPNLLDAQLSPDGQRLAVLMPLDGKKTLVVLPTEKDSGLKPQVGSGGEWEIRDFFWKSNELLFVTLFLMFAVKDLDERDFPGCAQALAFEGAQGRRRS